jgi:hypothetical protein
MRKIVEVLGHLIRTGLAIQDSKDENFIDDLGFIRHDLLMKNHNNAKIPFAYALDTEGNSHASCNQQRW